jgi:hypothetical protein
MEDLVAEVEQLVQLEEEEEVMVAAEEVLEMVTEREVVVVDHMISLEFIPVQQQMQVWVM